jgi:hypothetical protein
LCGRFYRRKDGTMLTANCPVGKRAYFVRVKALAATAVTLLFASGGAMAWGAGDGNRARGALAQKCDRWLWTVKGWLGLNPPVALMGDIVTAPPPPPASPQNTSNETGSSGNEATKTAQP